MTDRAATTLAPAQGEAAIHRVLVAALGTLLRAKPKALDEAIEKVLAEVGVALGADRAHVHLDEGGLWSNTHEWCAPGVASTVPEMQGLAPDSFTLLPPGFARGEVFRLDDVSTLPEGQARQRLERMKICAIACVPLTRDGILYGMLGLDRVHSGEGFGRVEIGALEALADGVLSAVMRLRSERALDLMRRTQQQTTERLRATLAAMPELVLEIDADGRCIDFHCQNPYQLAASPEKILNRTLEETLPSEVAALQRRAMAEALENGVSHPPLYSIGEGAKLRWYRLSVARVEGQGGRAPGYVFRIQDVTEQRARDEETAVLLQITRHMTNLVTVLDQNARLLWVNAAFEKRTGWTLAELRGRDPRGILVAPETDAATLRQIDAALEARSAVSVELLFRDRKDERYWVALDLQPVNTSDGQFAGFVCIETDITERKRQSRELEHLAEKAAAAHARLENAVDVMQDGFVLFDADNRLVMCNAKYREFNAEIADMIVPGVRLADLIKAGTDRGIYLSGGGQTTNVRENLLASLGATDSYETELHYRNGRIVRSRARRLAQGGHVGLRTDITALRQAEQRLNDIIRGAGVGTWELDFETGAEEVNDYWSTMLGYPPGALTQISQAQWSELTHPDDAARVRRELDRLRSGRTEVIEIETRKRHLKGHWAYLLSRGRVMASDENGRPLRMSGVDIDVTERRNVEERLVSILEASAVGTWQLDAVNGSVIIDDQYAAMLGYTREQLNPITHARFEALVHPEDLHRLQANVAALYGSGNNRTTHEFRMRHREGHWVWILSKTRVLRWAAPGVSAEESGVHLDITENKRREFALAEAKGALENALAARRAVEQRMTEIAEVSDDFFWEQDRDERFTYMSSGFERATGVPVSDVVGRDAKDMPLSFRASEETDWDWLWRQKAEQKPYSDFVYPITHVRDGTQVWLRVSGTPYYDEHGVFQGYRGVGSNVTALVAATERAEAANHAKSRFLANMSHELRTPLTGVLGMAELLSERVTEAEHRRMLETIRDSGEGLLNILNDILDLAKIEAGKLRIELQVFEPLDLLRRVEALFVQRAEAKGLSLAVDSDAACTLARRGDPHRILQILNNLVGNAIKFTELGGVSVSFSFPRREWLQIEVRDTGIGMRPDQTARVFDEFEQAEGTTARRFGGTGLGLSITRRLVELMEGTIRLESTPGVGTRVIVDLPLLHASVPEATHEPIPLPLSGLRVLVADDNRTNRRILATMLEGLGVKVVMVEDGQAALEAYVPGRFDLLLLDISMPLLDGVSALLAIRARELAEDAAPTPALAVTANAMQHQVEEYLAAGFAGHVAKPFRKAALAEAIGRHARSRADSGD